jgi:type VII secretion protein EccE
LDRMNAESARGGDYTVAGRLVLAQCLAIAVWAGVYTVGAPLLVAVTAGAGTALAMLVRVRGRGIVDVVRALWQYHFGYRTSGATVRDFPQDPGRPVGLRWDGTHVAAVVEVLPPSGGFTRLGRDSEDAANVLPLRTCL